MCRIFDSREAAQACIARLGSAFGRDPILTIERGLMTVRAPGALEDPLFDAAPFWGVERRLDGGPRPGALKNVVQWGGMLRLVDVAGLNSMTANLPAPLTHVGVGRGARLTFVPAETNTLPDPTISIGGITRTIRDIDGSPLRAGDLKGGRSYDLRVHSAREARVVTSGLSVKAASGIEGFGTDAALRSLLPTTGGGMHRSGPALFTPELWALEASRGLAGCPPPLALYRQIWSPGRDWVGRIRVAQPEHTPLVTPWEEDGNVIHPCVVEFYHAFRGYRYLLGITGYPGRREAFENPLLYGSNDLSSWTLLPDMPQPLARTPPLDPGANGHTSDIWLSHDPRSGNLIVGWRLTVRLDGTGSAPERIVNSLWFRESRDGYHWSPAQRMLEALASQDSLMSPCVLFDPVTCAWHMYSVMKPHLRHRTARSLSGPWSDPAEVTPPRGCRPHHLEVRWVGDTLVFLIHSMSEANLFFGTISDWRDWSFNEAPVITDPSRGCYKATFLPEMKDGFLSFVVLWTTGAGPGHPASGPAYQLLVARSEAVPVV